MVKSGKLIHARPTGIAKRIRGHGTEDLNLVVMTVVTCSDCGNRFEIDHRTEAQDVELAAKQAIWLLDQFVWDHIQEQKHHASIRLPGSGEIK